MIPRIDEAGIDRNPKWFNSPITLRKGSLAEIRPHSRRRPWLLAGVLHAVHCDKTNDSKCEMLSHRKVFHHLRTGESGRTLSIL